YFTPFYAMLRAVPPLFSSQFPGVLVMGAAVLILFVVPWLDRGRVKSIRYRGPRYKTFFTLFIIAFLILGYLGVEPTTVWGAFSHDVPLIGGDYIALWVARVLTVVYFLFFVLMPWYTAVDPEKPEPARVTW
ncbi:MAG: cytochrome b, partial [Bacillota bacterium]